ncbi:MAG: heavy-metal-associated domain-containing protein [Bryobacterales bacterium]|nr:heavy-metal-associated domain-containing protein [Bryobacterales bacterium]
MQDFVMKIGGMHCNSCINRVTKALEKVDGVKVNTVTIGLARVSYDPAKTHPQSLLDAVNNIGFTATHGE